MRKVICTALLLFISVATTKALGSQYDANIIDISRVTINGLHLIGKDKFL